MDVRLLSVRQAAALTGLKRERILRLLRRGRISSKYAQKVDGRWVLREDFKILKIGMNKDPLLASLPDEFVSDEPPKDMTIQLPELKQGGNPNPLGNMRKLHLPKFAKVSEGIGVWEIRDMTGVHPATQKRIRDGEPVQARVALRLARGLGVPVEDLMQ